jgi:hemerythrin-like domain-containing protein
MHDAMRRDAQRLVDAIDAAADLTALARWFARFEAVIEHHHQCEDEIVWPGLEAIIARGGCGDEGAAFTAACVGLLDDHERLDEAMAAVRHALHGESTVDTRRESAFRFRDGLDQHLTREEVALFPLLRRHIDEAAFSQLEEEVVKATPFTALTFTLPWVMDGASDELHDEILSDLPLPIRMANRWVFQPRYRRLVERAAGRQEGERS